MLKKFIPNIITLLNLFCGCIATVLAVQNNLVFAALFVGLGIFFDFFDGLAARSLGVSSELGLQLDSLADVVTSGVVPGIVMVQLLKHSAGSGQQTFDAAWQTDSYFNFDWPVWALFGLVVTLASAYRLAKFNVDDRQTSSFIGLPTPANAILILSLPLIAVFQPSPRIMTFIFNPWFLIFLTVFSAVLLNAELPLFALKFKNLSFKDNWFRYLFLVFSVLALIGLQFLALPLIILCYVLLSLLLHIFQKAKN